MKNEDFRAKKSQLELQSPATIIPYSIRNIIQFTFQHDYFFISERGARNWRDQPVVRHSREVRDGDVRSKHQLLQWRQMQHWSWFSSNHFTGFWSHFSTRSSLTMTLWSVYYTKSNRSSINNFLFYTFWTYHGLIWLSRNTLAIDILTNLASINDTFPIFSS